MYPNETMNMISIPLKITESIFSASLTPNLYIFISKNFIPVKIIVNNYAEETIATIEYCALRCGIDMVY